MTENKQGVKVWPTEKRDRQKDPGTGGKSRGSFNDSE